MENIRELLAKHEIELDEEKATAFEKDVLANYKTKGELEKTTEKKNERIKELETQLSGMSETVETLKADGAEVESLKEQVAAFRKADEERKAAEDEAAKRNTFNGLFDEAVAGFSKDGKNLASGLYREAVSERAYKMHNENPAMGIKDIINEITKDDPNAWVNPQREPHKMPIPGESLGTKPGINSLDDLKKLSSQQINENWDRVKEILATSKKG